MSDIILDNQKQGGDIFAAIDYTIDRLVDHCEARKCNKRVFLFTNGRGMTKFKIADFKGIVSSIKRHDIKLNIIPMDFMETYDFESN